MLAKKANIINRKRYKNMPRTNCTPKIFFCEINVIASRIKCSFLVLLYFHNIGGIRKGNHFFFAWYHAEHVLVVVYLEAYGKMWSKQNFSSFNCLPAEATVLDINLLYIVHFRRGWWSTMMLMVVGNINPNIIKTVLLLQRETIKKA